MDDVDIEGNLAWADQQRENYNNSDFAQNLGAVKSTVEDFGKSIPLVLKAWNPLAGPMISTGAEVVNNGGFILASGLTAGVEAGASFDGAGGVFLAVDFNDKELDFGIYYTGEVGANGPLPSPEIHGGGEITFLTSPNYDKALNGMYSISGATGSFAGFDLDVGRVTADRGNISGTQFTFGKSVSVSSLLDYSAYYHVGDGRAKSLWNWKY